jgi:hypothetical protein
MRRWTNKKINLRTPIFKKKKKKLFSDFRTVICVFYLLRHELHLFAEVVFVTLLADDLTIILLIKVILFPEKLNFFKRLWCFALPQCASQCTVEQTKQHCLESMDPGFFVFGRNKQNDVVGCTPVLDYSEACFIRYILFKNKISRLAYPYASIAQV